MRNYWTEGDLLNGWIDGDSATLKMNFSVDDEMSEHLQSLDCPISMVVRSCRKEPLVIEGCVIREDEDGFYIEIPDEHVGRVANWW